MQEDMLLKKWEDKLPQVAADLIKLAKDNMDKFDKDEKKELIFH